MKKFSIISVILLTALFSCKTSYEIQKTENKEYVLSDSSNSAIDSSIYRYIVPFKEKMESTMNVFIAESDSAIEKGVPEGCLGNLVADACLSESKKIFYPTDGKQADFAFLNNGGLRKSLPKGKITKQDVFELMPFENELVVLSIDGNLVKKIFNFIASKEGAPLSGARFRIKDKQAVDITINNEPIDTTKTYKALTSDYLANGGDSFEMLTGLSYEKVNLKVRDAILNYLEASGKNGKIISVKKDGRISNAR